MIYLTDGHTPSITQVLIVDGIALNQMVNIIFDHVSKVTIADKSLDDSRHIRYKNIKSTS